MERKKFDQRLWGTGNLASARLSAAASSPVSSPPSGVCPAIESTGSPPYKESTTLVQPLSIALTRGTHDESGDPERIGIASTTSSTTRMTAYCEQNALYRSWSANRRLV